MFLAVTILHYLGILGRFFSRSCFCFKSYEFFSNFIIVPLRKYSKDCEPSLVHGDAPEQGVPGGAAAPVGDGLQLDDGHADNAILPRKAVILHRQVHLVGSWIFLVTQQAVWINNVSLEQGVHFNSPKELIHSRNLGQIKVRVIL